MTRKIYVLNRDILTWKKEQRICFVWNMRVGGLSGRTEWEDPATCLTLFSSCRSKNIVVRLFWRDQWSYSPECVVQISTNFVSCGARKMLYATRSLTSKLIQIWHSRVEIFRCDYWAFIKQWTWYRFQDMGFWVGTKLPHFCTLSCSHVVADKGSYFKYFVCRWWHLLGRKLCWVRSYRHIT